MLRFFALRLIPLVAPALLACGREPSSGTTTTPSTRTPNATAPSAKVRAAKTPAEELAALGPIKPETAHHEPTPSTPSKPLKTIGSIGEDLEGDLSYFKVISIRPCTDGKSPAPASSGGTPNPAARTVVAAEVEIVAKRALNVTPRDLMLGKGGIMINASIDPKRELKGCTPLIKVARLQAKETAKGFVLFDIPTSGPGSNLKELNLVYHPARFGGSAQLYVKLAGG